MFRKSDYEAAGGYRPELYFAQDLDLALEGDMSPWYVMGGSETEIEHRVDDLVREIRQSRAAYEGIAERLIAFARFERFQPGALWWDFMCGGAFDGSFIETMTSSFEHDHFNHRSHFVDG